MRLPTNRSDMGDYLTIDQTMRVFNLGETTTRKLAREAGAERRIGKTLRIKKSQLADYIDQMYC